MTQYHEFDVLVVGAGGAGLMAALHASKEMNTAAAKGSLAVISKLYPTRSHTGTAQGGISAALGNLEPDKWEWHAYDTIKGGDFLCDQDSVEILCRDAIDAVIDLEHMGLPFDRTPEGKISQRRFGGHTNNDTQKAVMRACHAADRTGHMILQTLYQNCIKNNVNFFDEFQIIDLLIDNDGSAGSGIRCNGVVAVELKTGEIHVFHSKATMLASGGFGKMWKVTSNAHSLTGDLPAAILRHGLPLQDMEFFQFHPTGLYKLGILLSEAARGEGAVFLNSKGERFMERYMPTLKDLAPRDICSRFIYKEVREGRGIDGKDYVYLDCRPAAINQYFEADGNPKRVDAHYLEARLPDIFEFARVYLGQDPITQPVAIQPTAHYAMGGIPTDNDARVLADEKGMVVEGLYAAGEVACVSVHGANRLGTNSLVDLVVFGKRGGKAMAQYAKDATLRPINKANAHTNGANELNTLRSKNGRERPTALRKELQVLMDDKVGVYRTGAGLEEALEKIKELQARFQNIRVEDKGFKFNTDLMEAWELGALLELAEVTAFSALVRNESRGGHYREDYPNRDDANFLRHTVAWRNGKVETKYKPVRITRHQPVERKY
jgi:succinate dehydrogenase / fumarate reductase flavoprotein subunit